MSRADLVREYDKSVQDIPFCSRRSVASVLFNCVQSVASVNKSKGDNDRIESAASVIIGNTVVNIPQSGTNSTFTNIVSTMKKLSKPQANISSDIILLQQNDDIMYNKLACNLELLSSFLGILLERISPE